MAEVLGVIASSLQLAELAVKTGTQIYKFIDHIRVAPRKMKAFRRDLELNLSLLKDISLLLESAKAQYTTVGETASLVQEAIDNFQIELKDILKTVETTYGDTKRWRAKLKIGLKGDGEWVRIDSRVKHHYDRLTAASVQLSNKLHVENGKVLKETSADIQAVGIEITENVSAPICSIQDDIKTVIRAEDASLFMLQESIRLQHVNMSRVEELHADQFERIEELHETAIVTQEVCEANADSIKTLEQTVSRLETDIISNGQITEHHMTAFVQSIQSFHDNPITSEPESTMSKEQRIRLEQGKRKLSSRIRFLLRLSEDSSSTKILKGAEAEDFRTGVEEILEIMHDQSDVGIRLKQELPRIAMQLVTERAVFMQKTPSPALQKKLRMAGSNCESLLTAITVDSDRTNVENKDLRGVQVLEHGELVLSSRIQRRVDASVFEDEIEDVEQNITTIAYRPKLKEQGESKAAFVVSFSSAFGTNGTFSVPLLIRVYNRRYYKPLDKNSPRWLASEADLEGLQQFFSTGLASVYDTDENGKSLLHCAVGALQRRNKRTGFTQKCLALCRFLLAQGADTNIVDDFERTPLNSIDSIVFEEDPDSVDLATAQTAFEQVLTSSIENRVSPFGPEVALAHSIKGLISGTPWFLDTLLYKLTNTEFDINSYSGANNAIVLEFATAKTDEFKLWSRQLAIALKHGLDINARTWETNESCVHLLLRVLKINPTDPFMKTEASWQSFKKYSLKRLTPRLREMLRLGVNIYATDTKDLEFSDGKDIGCSITRDMYIHELQETWWEVLAEFGHSKEEVILEEAKDLNVPVEEYEVYLRSLAQKAFEDRQRFFATKFKVVKK
ncbi:hypothetical protein ABW21_db0205439 [Orbilia brochopaga]|nr:hypothetical protein ABW21_db0205439 [Drechslerella brochopaga]